MNNFIGTVIFSIEANLLYKTEKFILFVKKRFWFNINC